MVEGCLKMDKIAIPEGIILIAKGWLGKYGKIDSGSTADICYILKTTLQLASSCYSFTTNTRLRLLSLVARTRVGLLSPLSRKERFLLQSMLC